MSYEDSLPEPKSDPHKTWKPGPKLRRGLAWRVATLLRLWDDQEGLCKYCGQEVSIEEGTIDHRTPRAYGGDDNYTNLVFSCKSCNISKGGKTEEEWVNMLILRKLGA